ncbi:MAG TPA: glycosyl hydrolase family 65 protein [Acidimicrobiales bacterium]|nr:glycosyl hydrolase family 65 protein [Acidimicrobiales bacterium]
MPDTSRADTPAADTPAADAPGADPVAEAVRAVLAMRPDPGAGSPWYLVVDDPSSQPGVDESLLSLADGVTGTRGSPEEEGPGGPPGVFVAGVYERGAHGESLLEVPSWATLAAHDGPLVGTRLLDLRAGVLWREVRGEDGSTLRSARWACLARPGTNVLVALGTSEVLEVKTGSELVELHTSTGGGVTAIVETVRDDGRGRPEGHDTHLARVSTFATSSRRSPSKKVAAAAHERARQAGLVALLDEQRTAWDERWSEADIEIDGDDELTRSVRLALFHLMSSVPDRGEAGVGARGLSGGDYAGHVFWDADMFVMPVLAATHPAAARTMLEYRIRRLPAARRWAAASGRKGARFPWESGLDGSDVTPRSAVDGRGEVVAIRTGLMEEHITADVAWAAWQLASWQGSWDFLDGPGRRLVTETARYWASRVRHDDAGRAHIDHVIGPDEYHEDVEDNAYTNQMAAWNLRRAADVVLRRGSDAERGEARAWRAVADAVVDGWDPVLGRHHQFVGFDALEPLLVADVGPVPLAADRVLGHARVAASQVIKQADVLMLHHVIPEAVPAGSLAADMDYYLPRTAHGSSLSPAVHASLLARLGRLDEAVAYLDMARRIDLDDTTGSTAGGLHLATLGGLWQALVMGFAGVRLTGPDDDALVLDPHIPDAWRELRLRLRWHGHVVRLGCRGGGVEVQCSVPLRVRVGGAPATVVEPPGAWVAPPGA